MVTIVYKWLALAVSIFLTGIPATADRQASHSRAGMLHPFYISVTELNYNAAGKTIEISCKLFTNDLELALEKIYHEKPNLAAPKDKQLADKEVSAYIRNHLVIKLDGVVLPLEFLGFEKENEAVWSYLQGVNIPAPKTVEIVNSLLYDSFDQQINLMNVTVKGTRKSAKLVYPDTNIKFEF